MNPRMRTMLAAAMILVSAACGTSSPGREEERAVPVTGACPKVHSQRREVPIVYGVLKQDPATVTARQNLKFVYGGPEEHDGDPRITEVCDACWYVLDPRRKLWEKESLASDNFLRPMTDWIRKAPTFAAKLATRRGKWRQALAGETVVEESYSAVTALRFQEVWAGVLESAKGAQNVVLLEDAPEKKHLRAQQSGFAVEAWAFRDPQTHGIELRMKARKLP